MSEIQREIELQCKNEMLNTKASIHALTRNFVEDIQKFILDENLTDSPDIVMYNETDVIGFEHMRVSTSLEDTTNQSKLKHADNSYLKSAQDVYEKGRNDLLKEQNISDTTIANVCTSVTKALYALEQSSYDNYIKSMNYVLHDANKGHVQKIGKYILNMQQKHPNKTIHMIFLVEIHFPFDTLKIDYHGGCLTDDILDLIPENNAGLDGVVFVMHDILCTDKYSVAYIDCHNKNNYISLQGIKKNYIKDIFQRFKPMHISENCFDFSHKNGLTKIIFNGGGNI